MIKKRNLTNGVNANVSLEPTSASQATNNLTNNIFINKREDGKEDIVITRDVQPNLEEAEIPDVKLAVLEAYAQILLDQDKALIANLISKNTIIVPATSLQKIIKAIIPNC